MNDTSPRMEQRMREMILRKTPEERLAMGCAMYDFSKQLVSMAILRENPGLSPPQMRREIFLKMYGGDFSPVQQEKVIRHLMAREL